MGVETTVANLQSQTSYVENATQNIKRQLEHLHNSTSDLVSGECTSWNPVCNTILLSVTPCASFFLARSLHHPYVFAPTKPNFIFNTFHITFALFHQDFASYFCSSSLRKISLFSFIYRPRCQASG